MVITLLLVLAFILLVLGSYTDIRTREVPDWLNYSGIFLGLGLRLMYSLATFNYVYIVEGLIGFGIFFAIAIAMFYLGQWGGGDSKTMMAIGALLGVEFTMDNLAIAFVINSIFIGAIYGLIWIVFYAIKNRVKFLHTVKHLLKREEYKRTQYFSIGLAIFIFLLSFLVDTTPQKISLLVLAIFFIGMFYLFIFTKAVELSCMIKKIDPSKLTEGDWIAKVIMYKGKKIAGPGDLGIERPQIRKLIKLKHRHVINKVFVKEGMPFIPNFLITFIVTIFLGNLLLYFL